MSENKIAVIKTRLPYTDRRALSQAWFSALHLAGDARDAVGVRRSVHLDIPSAASTSRLRAAVVLPCGPVSDSSRVRSSADRRAEVPACEQLRRRASDCQAANGARRRFQRARSYPPFSTSITLEGASGTRVHLIVRRVGSIVHVVALCPPAVADLVRRALASADLHFRARGERITLDLSEASIKG